MKNVLYIYLPVLLLLILACSKKEEPIKHNENESPQIFEDGMKIRFPDRKSILFFETDTLGTGAMDAEIIAPAKVSAIIIKAIAGNNQRVVLFENQDLASNYTQLVQHNINISQIRNVTIRQKKIELERVRDLQQHGVATGKDLLEAHTALAVEETNLHNEEAANIEHETKLIAGGFQPEVLRNAPVGTAYIVCDIPESQLSNIRTGNTCTIKFSSFPTEVFKGNIEAIADLIDQSTRMVKLRVSIKSAQGKLKAGMFATVSFGVSEGNNLSINKNSIITIQGKDYVFVKMDSVTFQRREVVAGDQIEDRIIIYKGIKKGDMIARKGVMQLKGLSFGY